MKCEICGSKKNVRQFGGLLRPYTECRKCFEKAMKLSVSMSGGKLSKKMVEKEWNRGKENEI